MYIFHVRCMLNIAHSIYPMSVAALNCCVSMCFQIQRAICGSPKKWWHDELAVTPVDFPSDHHYHEQKYIYSWNLDFFVVLRCTLGHVVMSWSCFWNLLRNIHCSCSAFMVDLNGNKNIVKQSKTHKMKEWVVCATCFLQSMHHFQSHINIRAWPILTCIYIYIHLFIYFDIFSHTYIHIYV